MTDLPTFELPKWIKEGKRYHNLHPQGVVIVWKPDKVKTFLRSHKTPEAAKASALTHNQRHKTITGTVVTYEAVRFV